VGYYSVGGREKINVIDRLGGKKTVTDKVSGQCFSGYELDTRPVMIPEYYQIMFDSCYASEFFSQYKKFSSAASEV
jgi:hypothetical protein